MLGWELLHTFADAIIREHKHRLIEGDVVLLGRQAMLFSPDHAYDLLRAQGVEPASVANQTAMIDRKHASWRRKIRTLRIRAFSSYLALGQRGLWTIAPMKAQKSFTT